MTCQHCNNNLPEGLAMCFHCGKPTVSPNAAGEGKPPGVKKFAPQKLDSVQMHPEVRGTGFVCLIAFVAWLAALIWPIEAIARTGRGLWMLIPGLLDGTINDISGSFIESFALRAETFSGTFAWWSMANEIFGAAGGFVTFLLGMLMVFAVVIPMFFLLVALRKNTRAAHTILIANLCICIFGNHLCYSVIKRISDAIGILQPPYDRIPQTAMFTMIITAVVWLAGAIFYHSLTVKSARRYAQQGYNKNIN